VQADQGSEGGRSLIGELRGQGKIALRRAVPEGEKAGGKSVGVRSQEPREVDADTEGIAVELQRDTAAVVEFEIQMTHWTKTDSGVVAVVAHKVRGSGGDAGGGETLAIFCGTASTAFGGRAAAEDSAGDRLIAPRCDIVGGGREAELAGVVFKAAGKLSVIAEGDKRAMEVFGIHDRITHAEVEERREISKGVVDVIGEIPSQVTAAEALLRFPGGSGNMHGGTEVQGRIRKIHTEIREESTYANAGDRARIIFLDGRRSAYKIKRHAGIDGEVPGKVVAESGSNIVDRAIAAVTAFELGP